MIAVFEAVLFWELLERRVAEDRGQEWLELNQRPRRWFVVTGWCDRCRRTGQCEHIQPAEALRPPRPPLTSVPSAGRPVLM